MTLEEALQEAARDLPVDCNITITVERGSAYVEVTAPDDHGTHSWMIGSKDKSLAEQVQEATRSLTTEPDWTGCRYCGVTKGAPNERQFCPSPEAANAQHDWFTVQGP
jgi:hypothetical protein